MATRESIARSSASSGGAVVFAGCTVMVALLSLAVVDIPLVTDARLHVGADRRGRGLRGHHAAAGDPGDRRRPIDKLPIPLPHRKPDDHPHGWARWGETSRTTRSRRALVALVILVVLALPALDLYLGQQDNGAMPKSTERARPTTA